MATNYGKNYPTTRMWRRRSWAYANVSHRKANELRPPSRHRQVDVRREDDLKAALDAQKKRILDLKQQHDQVRIFKTM